MSSCCTPDGSCNTDSAETTTATATPSTATDGTTTVYTVKGVGSAHCQGVVSKAIGGLEQVLAVEVEIGTGLVTVTTGGEADDGLIANTVDAAGYEFAGRA